MNPFIILICIVCYFGLVYTVSYWASSARKTGLASFFVAERQAPWWAVAFGMVGSSLSGVTFVSVPGDVGQELVKGTGILKSMSYIQIVIGYFFGYVLIAYILLPIYYKYNYISIYQFLSQQFGNRSRLTGAFYFLLSRSLGAAARLYLAAGVLQFLILDKFGIPFPITSLLILLFIILYTRKSGIQSIVWTDVLQTSILILALIFTWFYLVTDLKLENPLLTILNSKYGKIFFFDPQLPNYFWKQFFSGIFIAVVMSGLDQDMMQKNLACRNLKDAKKNMISYGLLLSAVNLFFVALGVMLYIYTDKNNIPLPARSDLLFPQLAFEHFGTLTAVAVLIGLTASAYNAADGTLTALSTSISIDFIKLNVENNNKENLALVRNLQLICGFALLLMMIGFYYFSKLSDFNVISLVLSMAGYTYGPLLGMYGWGIAFPKLHVNDKWVMVSALTAPIICILLKIFEKKIGISLSYELLLINGTLTFIGILGGFIFQKIGVSERK